MYERARGVPTEGRRDSAEGRLPSEQLVERSISTVLGGCVRGGSCWCIEEATVTALMGGHHLFELGLHGSINRRCREGGGDILRQGGTRCVPVPFDLLSQREGVLKGTEHRHVPEVLVLVKEGDTVRGEPPEIAWDSLSAVIAVVRLFCHDVFLRETVKMIADGRSVLGNQIVEFVKRNEVIGVAEDCLDDVVSGFLRDEPVCTPLFLKRQGIITAKRVWWPIRLPAGGVRIIAHTRLL